MRYAPKPGPGTGVTPQEMKSRKVRSFERSRIPTTTGVFGVVTAVIAVSFACASRSCKYTVSGSATSVMVEDEAKGTQIASERSGMRPSFISIAESSDALIVASAGEYVAWIMSGIAPNAGFFSSSGKASDASAAVFFASSPSFTVTRTCVVEENTPLRVLFASQTVVYVFHVSSETALLVVASADRPVTIGVHVPPLLVEYSNDGRTVPGVNVPKVASGSRVS